MQNKIKNTHLAVTFGLAIMLLSAVAATIGTLSLSGSNFAALAQESDDDFSSGVADSGNYIINYIYEIELENKDAPRLELDDDSLQQGASFVANGANFDANATADVSLFDEQLFALSEDGNAAERSAALLLTRSNLTISEDGDGLIVENADDETEDGDGTVLLVTNISPSDASSQAYGVSLECGQGPDGDGVSESFDGGLAVDNSTSKQFFELSLPSGEYKQCQIVMSPEDEDDPSIESSTADLRVLPDLETATASINGTTDDEGSFMQDIAVAPDAQTGRYVVMAETANDTDDTIKRAVAPLTIISDETSTTGTASGDNTDSTGTGGGSNTTLPPDTNGDSSGNDSITPGDNGSQGPPTPPDNGGDDGSYIDLCQNVDSDSGNVNNTITQSSSQSASNTISDDDVINVVQKIHGTYNGTGHLNTSISIDDSDTVSQSVDQDVVQNAVIKKCPGEPGEGGNQTNTIDMNATQLASNAYSDNTTIIIVQTIIIPKDCNTDVNAPIEISDRDTVTQSVDQDINQDGEIAYGGSGEGSNTVVQTSMQVAHNNATNDEVITINQVIIVPPDCPVEIHAPIVVEGDDDVQMSVVQNAEQDASIDSSAGGVTIASSVSGSDYITNTVVTTASQDGQNTFSDDDVITIQQNVYYVNDTTGWNETNYEENLVKEFGDGTDSTGNSTMPLPPSNSTSNSTSTQEMNSTAPPGDQGSGDNSTAAIISSAFAPPPPPDDNATTTEITYEDTTGNSTSDDNPTEDSSTTEDNSAMEDARDVGDEIVEKPEEESPPVEESTDDAGHENTEETTDTGSEETGDSTEDATIEEIGTTDETTPEEEETSTGEPPTTEETTTEETTITSEENDAPPADNSINDQPPPAETTGNSTVTA